MGHRVLRLILGALAITLISTVPAIAQNGIEPYKNYLAPYVGSPEQAVQKMLDMASLKPGETLYDLGCGDGRILVAAAKRYRVNAVGIELSDKLAKRATDRAKNQGVEDKVKVIHGDFMKTDLSHADVVTLYLVTTANQILRPNLERELRPNTRVVSYDYPIPGWKPIDTAETGGISGTTHTIYLYQVPASLKR